jgi:hypothetical protein
MAENNGNGGAKTEGTTYNIKAASAQPGPDGKTVWTLIGRAFIRADGSGGALFVGEGDNERKYSLFLRDRKRTQKPVARATQAPVQPAAGL